MDLRIFDIYRSVHLIQEYDLAVNLFNFYCVLFNKILDLFSMT